MTKRKSHTVTATDQNPAQAESSAMCWIAGVFALFVILVSIFWNFLN